MGPHRIRYLDPWQPLLNIRGAVDRLIGTHLLIKPYTSIQTQFPYRFLNIVAVTMNYLVPLSVSKSVCIVDCLIINQYTYSSFVLKIVAVTMNY